MNNTVQSDPPYSAPPPPSYSVSVGIVKLTKQWEDGRKSNYKDYPLLERTFIKRTGLVPHPNYFILV